jgi:hypothetical protein
MFSPACDGVPEKEEISSHVAAHVRPGDDLAAVKAYVGSSGKEIGLRTYPPEVTMASDYPTWLISQHNLDPDTPVFVTVTGNSSHQVTLIFVLDSDLIYQELLLFEDFTGP